ncbi:MAG: DUF349 domain-containing protein, partial [Burkholderiales bacterium]|nr:DUF349 domain-containing protein [Burkholderiales bacterium]
VLQASQALDAANASGDAQAIRAAMGALEAVLKGAAQAPEAVPQPSPASTREAPPSPVAALAQPRKPVVAVRGDDRPGMKRAEPAAPAGRGRPGERRDAPRRDERRPERDGRREFGREREGPRLGDAAFRAQRDALDHAQAALKKLAVQAHGEALTHLLTAWEQRDAAKLPTAAEIGGRVTPAVRGLWIQALAAAPSAPADETLLRLEIAAEVPTPAEQIDARRALQLQLLTRRNEPAPAQTWGQDVARVLAAAYDVSRARRLQQALKALLKR